MDDDRSYKQIVEESEKLKGYVLGAGNVLRCSTRLKYYGDELVEVLICNKAIFNPNPTSKNHKRGKGKKEKNDADDIISEIEENTESDGGQNDGNESADNKSADNERSKRRARKKVFDYSMCNPDLDLFVTFTLDGKKIDRYDYKPIIKKLNTWLDNRVRRNGLKYVFVCERHKDGALHFHGILNSKSVKLTDSGKTDINGHKIYNVEDWAFGFSTAIYKYGNHVNVCKYITKYITKSGEKVGGRWYYSSNNLNEPIYEYMGHTTLEDYKKLKGFECYKKELKEIRTEFTILTKNWK